MLSLGDGSRSVETTSFHWAFDFYFCAKFLQPPKHIVVLDSPNHCNKMFKKIKLFSIIFTSHLHTLFLKEHVLKVCSISYYALFWTLTCIGILNCAVEEESYLLHNEI